MTARRGEWVPMDSLWHDDDSDTNARLRRSAGLTALGYAAVLVLSAAACVGFALWLINMLLPPAGS
ncbi:MAG TPA: hypothetical protein VI159_03815 [Gemmatimonadales bacterium]